MSGWHVALLFNLKTHVPMEPNAPPDALAEYDSHTTVDGLRDALQAGGHRVTLLEADESLLDTLRQVRPTICFNIAEGLRGSARESHVPALLEMLDIPYTGSGVLAHALSLDKASCKRIWRDHGLPTAPFQVFRTGHEPLSHELEFPLFVKPVREGSGMGINEHSTVYDEYALRDQVRWVISTYHQPALVEDLLPGREFTVGVVGNTGNSRRQSVDGSQILYDTRGYHVTPIMEIDVSPVAPAGTPYSSYLKSERPLDLSYLCPAPIPDTLREEMQHLAVQAFEALGALDISRVDFRLGRDGRPYLLEINTLPGLNPIYSDIVMAARAGGLDYALLVNEILHLAAERYRLPGAGKITSMTSLSSAIMERS